jgi:hypothetical protein
VTFDNAEVVKRRRFAPASGHYKIVRRTVETPAHPDKLQTDNRGAVANGRVDPTVASMLHYGSGGKQ